jgi:subtilase family serine protease
MRVFPDVALDGADSTPGLMGQTYTDQSGTAYHEFPVSGTSLSCPLFAGIQALAQQAQGRPIGFANPALCARYRTAAYHDVTDHPLGRAVSLAVIEGVPFGPGGTASYWAVTLGTDGDLHATPGYDDVTGLGSPARAYLSSFRTR